MSTTALDRNIYARKVPGISAQSLMEAMQNEDKKKEPQISSAFTQTSPVVYQHYQNSLNNYGGSRIGDLDDDNFSSRNQQQRNNQQQQQQQHNDAVAQRAVSLASTAPTIASLTNTVRAGVASTEESLEKVRKRIAYLEDRVRDQQQKAENISEKVKEVRRTACATVWLMAVFGSLIMILLIAIIVLLVLHTKKNNANVESGEQKSIQTTAAKT